MQSFEEAAISDSEQSGFDWDEAEAAVVALLQPKLKDLYDLAARADSLVERSLEEVKKSGETFSSSAQVYARLLLRIAQDLRAVVVLSGRGHTLQALTIASTIFEQAHALGYIGEDNDRAERWLNHADEGRSYPSKVSKAISATADRLEDPEFAVSGADLYRTLCMAKHGNPVLQRHFGVVMEPGVMHLQRGPFVSTYTVALVRWCLDVSIRYVLLAILLFSRFRMREDLAVGVAGEMTAIHEELEAASHRARAETHQLLERLDNSQANSAP